MLEFLKKYKNRIIAVAICIVCCALISFIATNYISILYGSEVSYIDLKDVEVQGFEKSGNELVAIEDNPQFKINVGREVKKVKFNIYRN